MNEEKVVCNHAQECLAAAACFHAKPHLREGCSACSRPPGCQSHPVFCVPVPQKLTEEDVNNLQYFHNHKGDITRYDAWEELQPVLEKVCPELLVAVKNLDIAQRTLDAVVESLDKYVEDEG